jgi:superfamily I DNA and RNA helicase
MDKRVIFAVAGSGKTTYLINSLNLERNFLVITYTNNNLQNLKIGIINRFGYFPKNIKLFSYFSFLYSFCFKPFLLSISGVKGITFEQNENRFLRKNEKGYYIDRYNRLYSSRISKLLIEFNITEKVKARISKYFDALLIDEVQDFGGNDFNFLKEISKSNVSHIYVGDFYQHTYDTSRDGSTNKNLHENFQNYKKVFENIGLTIDLTTLNKSYRCSPTICNFISKNLGISIESHREDETLITYSDNIVNAGSVIKNSQVVKLFYREHYKFNCYSRNWGDCKGEDKYNDVCVVLNKTTLKHYKSGKLFELSPTTRNKFYVALTRTKNNLYLLPETLFNEN